MDRADALQPLFGDLPHLTQQLDSTVIGKVLAKDRYRIPIDLRRVISRDGDVTAVQGDGSLNTMKTYFSPYDEQRD